MYGTVLVIGFVFKEVGIWAWFHDLLATKFDLELAFLVLLSDSYLLAFLLLFLRVHPVSVVLLLEVGRDDGLLNQIITGLP